MANVYEIVTEQIIESLDNGIVPWRKPWSTEAPKNLVSKKDYRGVNILLLGISAAAQGFESPYWVTFKQAKALGGSVKKGEKSTAITFYKTYKSEDKETGEEKSRFVLRYYRVFNIEQTEGIDESKIPEVLAREHSPEDSAEAIVAGYVDGPEVMYGGDSASYNPNKDIVRMPNPERFESGAAFYSTLFHELTHSTGHKTRLDRRLNNRYGSGGYGVEELIAEIGSSFLMAHAGIENDIEQTAAYIDGWKKAIAEDSNLIIKAASKAQAAADRILGAGV